MSGPPRGKARNRISIATVMPFRGQQKSELAVMHRTTPRKPPVSEQENNDGMATD